MRARQQGSVSPSPNQTNNSFDKKVAHIGKAVAMRNKQSNLRDKPTFGTSEVAFTPKARTSLSPTENSKTQEISQPTLYKIPQVFDKWRETPQGRRSIKIATSSLTTGALLSPYVHGIKNPFVRVAASLILGGGGRSS
jgi:hypothetical protein